MIIAVPGLSIFVVVTLFRHKGLHIFCILLVTEALLRCRVVVVEKLKNCRVPSSTQDTHRGFKTNSGWKSEQGRHLFHFLTLNARHRQFVSSVHCPKNNLNLRQKNKLVPDWANATVYVWYLCQAFTVASDSSETDSGFMQTFRLFLGQCSKQLCTLLGENKYLHYCIVYIKSFQT